MAFNNFRVDEEQKRFSFAVSGRLLGYLKPYKKKVIAALILVGISTLAELANPYFLKVAVDRFISVQDRKGLLILAGIMIVFNIGVSVCSRLKGIIMAKVANHAILDIRRALYQNIQRLPYTFFDERPVGKILARIISDTKSLNDLFQNSITTLIPSFFLMISVAVIMFLMNWKLALATVSLMPLILIAMSIIQAEGRKRELKLRSKISNYNAYTHEIFSGVRVVQSFNAEKDVKAIMKDVLTDIRKATMRAVTVQNAFWPFVDLSYGIGTLVVLASAMFLSRSHSVTIGDVVAFISYVGLFWQPVMNITDYYNTLVTNMAGAERIFEILDLKPDYSENTDYLREGPVRGDVRFDGVSFAYQDGPEILHHINLHIRRGETVALVGATGAGKTTIANLLARNYTATGGVVRIDGADIREFSETTLRRNISIMMQDSFLFTGTIRDNIRYGRLDATDEEVEKAARTVSAHEFIRRLPAGYDTMVNERGASMSLGQRQLVSFARTLLADPQILILDEATASVDTQTERLVQKGIERVLAGRTSIVIAHRLSTIRNADRILVMEDGNVIEEGCHNDLMVQNGSYTRLYEAQFSFLHS